MPADLAALIARVEAATGPSRELDAEIDEFLRGRPRKLTHMCLYYTSSFDAALSLARWASEAETMLLDAGEAVQHPEPYYHTPFDPWPSIKAALLCNLRGRAA